MPTLEWIGKDKVINYHQQVPFRVLERKYSYDQNGIHDEDNDSENKIIHGDNLEALKALLPQYESKIKCIYIDPPYNTGNEGWCYNDNVNDPKIKKWLGEVVGKEGEDLSRHDKWLCMMYPRLKLLYKLLSKDGAIFISIDYREQANLKMICNEIFGVSNYITEIACINNPKGRSDDKYFATAHESIVVYRKSCKFEIGGFEPEEKITKRYNKIDLTGRKYREIDLRKTGDEDLRQDRPDMYYPFFFNEETGEIKVGKNEENTPEGFIRILPMKSKTVKGRWRWGWDTSKNNISALSVRYMPQKKQWGIFEMDYLDNREPVTPTTNWNFKDVNSERGTEMFIKFLGFNKQDFPNPKPVGTIKRIIQIASKPGDIILDSFSGSGTTAQAVLQKNNETNEKRKFILVEMMDYAENITAERVKRVISGTKKFKGLGGDFSYYELGEQLLLPDGNLNENVEVHKIREYVYYMETKESLQICENIDNKYYLGRNKDTVYYFYYEKDEATTLDHVFLSTVGEKADGYIIYADLCTLSESKLKQYNITFKKIPRDIARL
ncbi:site-specific DNA-methyltransferase [Clostridium sp. LBM24168]